MAAEAAELLHPLGGHDHVALAVSGGPDSMALLRLVADWARNNPKAPALTALTVDHGLRAESAAEAAQVAAWCDRIGIRHHILTWDGEKPTSRIQERARDARYNLMTAWCQANDASALVLAHQAEDQAETLLMRLARASGVDGLGGMAERAVRDGIVLLRPLLGVPRGRLMATLQAFGQDHLDDPSNHDTRYERVRLRAAAPVLADLGLEPAALGETARKLARAAAALDHAAEVAVTACTRVDNGGYAWIDRDRLKEQPDEIRLRVLARVLHTVGGGGRLDDPALERLVEALVSERFAGRTLGRCRILPGDGGVLVAREARELPRLTLAPGSDARWDSRFDVSLGTTEEPVELAPLGARGFAEACRRDASLGRFPAAAGAVLPGGFRDGALALAPELHDTAPLSIREHGLAVRFVARMRC